LLLLGWFTPGACFISMRHGPIKASSSTVNVSKFGTNELYRINLPCPEDTRVPRAQPDIREVSEEK
jgi:hypothetical protein